MEAYIMTSGAEKAVFICTNCGKVIHRNVKNCYKIIKFVNYQGKLVCSLCKFKKIIGKR